MKIKDFIKIDNEIAINTIVKHKGNRAKAAKELGCSYYSLYSKKKDKDFKEKLEEKLKIIKKKKAKKKKKKRISIFFTTNNTILFFE